MIIKNFRDIRKTDTGYCIYGDAGNVMLVFMTPDIIRIRASFDQNFKEESYALVTTAWEDRMDELLKEERTRIKALDIPYTETDTHLTFQTEALTLELNKAPFGFKLYNKGGELIYSDLNERAFERDHIGRIFHYSKIDLPGDHFYGFGENTGHIDKAGQRVRIAPKDAIGHDPESGGPLYKHVPFYIRVNERNRHALGLFYHNSYDCTFDMGGELSGYWDRYCYYQADGGDIDLFLLNGPEPAQVVDNYTLLTGRSAMPTKQSLGFAMTTMYYCELEKDCDKEIYKVIQKHIDEDMFIDNFWMPSGYTSGEKDNLRYTFNWNLKRFPDPEGFIKKMDTMGINLVPNIKPGVLKNHPYASQYEENDAFIKKPDGSGDYVGRWWGGSGRFVDFTGSAGRNTWKALLKSALLEKGIFSIWNDNCEYDGVEDRNAVCDFEGNGGTMAQLKVIHSNMMAYTGKQALAEMYPERRPYIVSRAGHSGIQRYAQVWAGDNRTDWQTLKFNIATLVGMGISGMANTGCDIGGFAGSAPEGELLLRWIQNGIFQPRFCINSANSDNTVTQPWMYEENNEYVRTAYRLRYRMLPYLYSLMYEAHRNGKPVMRPLFFEFPEDTVCYSDRSFTFMFGSSILVANVLEKGAKTRSLYLPFGTVWYDMNDNLRVYQGGQEIELPVDNGSIPMFLRGSAVYVTNDDVTHILRDSMKRLDVLVAAESDCDFHFYDDDGYTKDFESGVYAYTHIRVKSGSRTVISFDTEGSYKSTLERLELRFVSKERGAFWVTADGRKLPQFLNKDIWDRTDEGWYYNLSDRTIMVKCAYPQTSHFEMVISCEKFDLIGMDSNDLTQ